MASPEGPTFYRPLMDSLDDLSNYTFQRFKLYLEDRDLLRDFGTVPRSRLETEDRTEILKAMLDAYGIFTVTVTKRLLRHLYMSKLLKELSQWHYDPLAAVAACQDKLKSRLKTKFHVLIERISECGDEQPFSERYTELYVSLEESGLVNSEHEFRHMERDARKDVTERTVQCQDIFKGHTRRGEPIRVVLTKGVAGIGKTVLTQKFSLDWAEGRANQDVQLLFPFTFRELNVLQDKEYSLVGLLHHCFSETKDLWSFQHLQMVLIFDGLDECRLPLNFSRTRVLTAPTESASVEVLLVNIIRGSLLPSARLWITTRPAAASQIHARCISLVTEVRGFSDPQKEQYFRKRFRDDLQAAVVISHIKKSRSLYIMCQMPVFCRILSTVIENIMKVEELQELPQTLTNLYIHFLVVQLKQKNVKFDGKLEAASAWSPENREMVQSLCKLAFEQLQKRNLIFYKTNLNECGLDTEVAARYSGVLTEVFREEGGLYRDLVYCFVHLSVQEFLAALHVHQSFIGSGVNLLSTHAASESPESVESFYQTAIDCALQSPNGHLDLFLRFLLGLSLPNNQSLLRELLSRAGSDSTPNELTQYIKKKMRQLPAEKNLNMFHCLNELNEKALMEYLQKGMRARTLSKQPMVPLHWSGVAFLLLTSDTDLEQFDLRKFQSSERALLGLLPVVREASRANLSWGHLSPHSCGPLASVLGSSGLTFLDLSNNDLQDSGVELLCSGLKSAPCRLETLRLSGCLVTERGGACLASALSSASSRLTALDLSYNHLGPAAALLAALRDQPHSLLDSLRLSPAGERWLTPGIHKYFCDLSLDMNTINSSLRLSDENRTVAHVCGECVKDQSWSYPDHSDRFSSCPQTLCSPGLTGRCYWEVEWKGVFMIDISVSHRGIGRKGSGDNCRFGHNDQSWSLRIHRLITPQMKDGDKPFLIRHNKTEARLSSTFQSHRVGVFLDAEAGVLSFYQVLSKGELSHLHTIRTAFKEPLFAGFGVDWCGSSLTLVKGNMVAAEDTRL